MKKKRRMCKCCIISAKNKIKYKHAGMNHFLMKKANKTKRVLKKYASFNSTNLHRIRKMLVL